MKQLLVAKLSPLARTPKRQHSTDAGYDLASTEEVLLKPGQRRLVSTGIAVAIPAGHVGYITPRSGAANRDGLSIVNSPGTIDAGYRGEIKVNLINLDPETAILIGKGERIAQLIIHPIATPDVAVAAYDLLPMTSRGTGGHGSTGRGVQDEADDSDEPSLQDQIRDLFLDGIRRGLRKGGDR